MFGDVLTVYKIGEFSKKTGVPIKTLRYYDEIDLFKPSYQDDYTGYRYYEHDQLPIINKIVKLKELNLSLKEIKDYIETSDISILLDKEKEFRLKIEAITNYVDEISYEIKPGTYDDYIKWNGLRMAKTLAAIELKEGTAKLYMVFKDGEFYDTFFVYPNEENLSSIDNSRMIYNNFEFALNYLKNEYDYITLIANDEKREKIIRDTCKIIEETNLEQKGWDGTIWYFKKFKIQLKDN